MASFLEISCCPATCSFCATHNHSGPDNEREGTDKKCCSCWYSMLSCFRANICCLCCPPEPMPRQFNQVVSSSSQRNLGRVGGAAAVAAYLIARRSGYYTNNLAEDSSSTPSSRSRRRSRASLSENPYAIKVTDNTGSSRQLQISELADLIESWPFYGNSRATVTNEEAKGIALQVSIKVKTKCELVSISEESLSLMVLEEVCLRGFHCELPAQTRGEDWRITVLFSDETERSFNRASLLEFLTVLPISSGLETDIKKRVIDMVQHYSGIHGSFIDAANMLQIIRIIIPEIGDDPHILRPLPAPAAAAPPDQGSSWSLFG